MSLLNNRNRRRIFGAESLPMMSPIVVNKRLNFEIDDQEDDHVLQDLHQFDLELDSVEMAMDLTEEIIQDKFSPCRTRSGRVYESVVKKRRLRLASKRSKRPMRSRTHSGQSGTGSLADCSENESETSNSEYTEDLAGPVHCALVPPPLNKMKAPMSRLYQARDNCDNHDIPSSPISSCMVDDRLSPIKHATYGRVSSHFL